MRPSPLSRHLDHPPPAFLLVYKFIDGVFLRENDFLWHYLLGRTFLAGTPYLQPGGEAGTHYPLGRVAIDGLLAAMPCRLARAVVFLLSAAAFGWALVLWPRMAQAARPAAGRLALAAAVRLVDPRDDGGL